MKNKFFALIMLALALASGPAWGQPESKIVIVPEHPDSNDLITFSVTNSACFLGDSNSVQPDLSANSFFIQLFLLFTEPCLTDDPDDDPDGPDFERTVGPLEPGEYSIRVALKFGGGGRLNKTIDERTFTVAEAPPAESLPEGGINGLYYNPAADGHFLYVLETDFTTLVVWTTFDADGKQAWMYGTGELQNGKTVVADTYITRNGRVTLDGEFEAAQEEHWGQLEVDLTSCLKGTVSYQSDLPEFGSGEFPIVRLAFAKQIGCVDAE